MGAGTTLLANGHLEFPQLGAAPGPGVSPAGGARLYYNGTAILVSYAGGAYATLASPDFTTAVTINTSTAPALDILTDAVSGTILRVQHDVSTTPTGALTAVLADLTTNWAAGNVGHTGVDIRIPATTAVAANGVAALAINSDATVARVVDLDVANVSGTIAQIRYGALISLSEKLTGLLVDLSNTTPGSNSIQGLEILTAAGTAADSAGTAVLHIDSNCTLQRVVDVDVANTGGTIAGVRYGGAATLTAALTGLSVNLNTNVTPSAGASTYINGLVIQVPNSIVTDFPSAATGPGVLTVASGALIVYSRQTLGRVADFLGENLGGTHVFIRYPVATTITATVSGLNVNMNTNVGAGGTTAQIVNVTAQIVNGIVCQITESTAVDTASTVLASALTANSGALILFSRATLGRVVDVMVANTGGTLAVMRYHTATTITAALTGISIDLSTNVNAATAVALTAYAATLRVDMGNNASVGYSFTRTGTWTTNGASFTGNAINIQNTPTEGGGGVTTTEGGTLLNINHAPVAGAGAITDTTTGIAIAMTPAASSAVRGLVITHGALATGNAILVTNLGDATGLQITQGFVGDTTAAALSVIRNGTQAGTYTENPALILCDLAGNWSGGLTLDHNLFLLRSYPNFTANANVLSAVLLRITHDPTVAGGTLTDTTTGLTIAMTPVTASSVVTGISLSMGANAIGPAIDILPRGYIQMSEMTAPAAPAADKGRLYLDVSATKTRLMILFQSGAAQQIAIEP